ncbi:Heat shock protein [Thalictrum thalictroides]|uniref:Heat shock protein n=1 Tax=Thalictrum thalictroides TaxID=46969 RepID=A0A7J6VPF2_THATH|nr:Heat shock protein [Thalictrum thalictroides]
MLNSFVVLKKPMGPPSGPLTRFCPLLRSSKVVSPSIFLKRGNGTSLFFHPVGVTPLPATRSINTTPARQMKEFTESLLSDDDDEVEVEFDEDSGDDTDDDDDDERVSGDMVRQFMKYIDLIVENIDLLKNTCGRVEAVEKSRSYAKKGDDALYVRVEMAGLCKEDVKVSVEKNYLVIKGEEKNGGIDEKRMIYDGKVKMDTEVYKVEEIKAEMKDGVLKVVVPKLKEEERKDIIKVQID